MIYHAFEVLSLRTHSRVLGARLHGLSLELYRTQAYLFTGNMQTVSDNLNNKYNKLKNIIESMGSVLVAFSGGTDSTLVVKAAKDALQDHVLAVTAQSETTGGHELQEAIELANLLDVEHLIVQTNELESEEFTRNDTDRCYVCKKLRFSRLLEIAKNLNIKYVVDGTNVDDLGDYRPGSKAAAELNIQSPLQLAGFTKQDVRDVSGILGLPTWDKPASACLASRIPYGSSITVEKLRQIDHAETFLRKIIPGSQIRVRHHGDIARIETDHRELPKVLHDENRKAILAYFRRLGFAYVTADLGGYQTGSLNQTVLRR